MHLEEIRNIPEDHIVTYACIVVDFRPQKKDPNRVRITAGGVSRLTNFLILRRLGIELSLVCLSLSSIVRRVRRVSRFDCFV